MPLCGCEVGGTGYIGAVVPLFWPLKFKEKVRVWGSGDGEWGSEDEEWGSEDEEWGSEDEEWGSEDEEWGIGDEME